MLLTNEGLKNRQDFAGYRLPCFNREEVIKKTMEHPAWLHFGAGNIFKAFQADACQRLLEAGHCDTGIIAVERRKKQEDENDGLFIKVTLKSDGNVEKAVIASVSEQLFLYGDEARLTEIFENPSLQMVSFTITEKGYLIRDVNGDYLPEVEEDLSRDRNTDGGPAQSVKSGMMIESVTGDAIKGERSAQYAKSYMGKITAMLFARYKKNKAPLAMVSMDNYSHNGDKLKDVIMTFAKAWDSEGFGKWLEESVSFPCSMIDKVTPVPDESVSAMLEEDGLPPGTPFVNAEESEYLVIEDSFPNGRPALEKAGIYFTDRETVDKMERMKVCTCLNPLHTGLAIFGCLLGYQRIWQEMQDEDLRKLAEKIGLEGLPVVSDPGIIKPRDFIDTVLKERLPNPFMPDSPQRIASDTSQKLPIRFGETIKAYLASDRLSVSSLRLIPLVYAAWLRYLMAIDDNGTAFELSYDPLLGNVQPYVKDMKLGEEPDCSVLEPLLRNDAIFGVDLSEAGLSEKVCAYFTELTAGIGAVRTTLHKYVTSD